MSATPSSPSAFVEPGATLAEGVTLGAFAVIKAGTVLGKGVCVAEHAVLGGDPQDLTFDPTTPSGVEIGAGCRIREGVTIHRSTRDGEATVVGEQSFLMTNAHVGHDCRVGPHVILASGVLLGGHVEVGAHAFLGGNAVVHQFVRIGEGAIISGGSRIAHDVPPFVMAEGHNRAAGLNLIGVKRRGFGSEVVSDLKRCYRAVLLAPGNPAANATKHTAETPPGRQFLAFFAGGQRGFIKSRAKRG
ncbi:MAG: acyl-ACP--UDP-N-acetylglucosamine O-acyltransferase [Opitutales bacterium]